MTEEELTALQGELTKWATLAPDFVRARELAGRVERLQTSTQDFERETTELAERLGRVMTSIGGATDVIAQAARTLSECLGEASERVGQIPEAPGDLGTLVERGRDQIEERTRETLGKVTVQIEGALNATQAAVEGWAAAANDSLGTFIEDVQERIVQTLESLAEESEEVRASTIDLLEGIDERIREASEQVRDVGRTALGQLEARIAELRGEFERVIGTLQSGGESLSDIVDTAMSAVEASSMGMGQAGQALDRAAGVFSSVG